MKVTNKHKFGNVVENWLKFDEYDYHPGVYSATTLLQPIRIILMKERHYDDVTVDVESFIASRYGTAIHDSFEKSNAILDDVRQEKRTFATMGDKKISGKFDILLDLGDNKYRLGDIKSTSVNAYIFKSKDEKYSDQLSIYRWLLMQQPDFKGAEIEDTATIIQIYTDWSKKKALESKQKGDDYPQTRIKEIEIPLASLGETEKWLKGRLGEIEEAKELSDDNLPRCSDEDLWRSQEKFAVKKPSSKRAWRTFTERETAEVFIDGLKNPEKYIIEHRPGVVKRCVKYCPYYVFCSQYKEFEEAGLIPNEYESEFKE